MTAQVSTTQVNTSLDPSSVYYVHPSDASSTQLVSVKFNGTGYKNWKRSMMLTLSAKNKLGFVNGLLRFQKYLHRSIDNGPGATI